MYRFLLHLLSVSILSHFAQAALGPIFGLGQHHGHDGTLSAAGAFPSPDGQSVMERVYTKYGQLPVGRDALKKAGWTVSDICDPRLGYAWTEDKHGLTKKKPLVLYTTASGQPSGVGVVIRNQGAVSDSQMKWTTEKPRVKFQGRKGVTYFIDVAFRQSSSNICREDHVSDDPIGDALIVNPGGKDEYDVPLTASKAAELNWYEGSCFDGMGTHWFLDTAGGRPPTWSGSDLFPVVAMYGTDGKINAMFFVAFTNQVTAPMIAANWWEPKGLSNSEMCANMCAGDTCTFLNHDMAWSTMHIYFNHHKNTVCPQRDDQCDGGIPFMWGRVTCCSPGSSASAWTYV